MAKVINDILLVPVDFTEITMNAVRHAMNLADKSPVSFKIALLHVINRESKAQLKKELLGMEAIFEKLEKIKAEIQKENLIEVDLIAREGSIFDVIAQVAGEIGARFMILGTHGKKGLQYLFGSFAFKVITQSPCPVIVVQEKSPASVEYNKIIFPINIFTEPRQQVQFAIRSARNLGSRIVIFAQLFNDVAANNKVRIITNQIESEFARNDVQYEVYTAEKQSNFVDQLIEFSKHNKGDLIMIMTDSSIDRPDFNNSSWSEALIFNDAAIPVLCINPVYLGEIYFTF